MNHDSIPLTNTRLLWCIASRSLNAPFYMPHMFAALMLCLCLSQSVFAQSNAQNPDQTPDIEQQYKVELEKWMLRAYEGDRDAQFRVGVLYTNSQFNQPDFEQAVYWYKQAARQDHVLAQYNLGHQYLTGVGVKPSQTIAMSWWLKAAKQDHALAQFNIGRAYYLGIGFAEDHALSRKWFERAAANNEPKSIDILQQLGWTDADGALAAADLVDATDLDVTEKTASELSITDLGQTDDANQVAATESDNMAEIEDEQFAAEGQIENQVIAAPEDLNSVFTAVELTPNDSTPINSTTESEVKGAAEATQDQVNTELASQAPVAQKAEVSATRPIVGKLSMPIDPAFKAYQQPVSDSPTVAVESAAPTIPIALYTNPAVRSVLIAIVNDASQISIQRETGPWSIVRSSAAGFPVWVHGDFIMVDVNIGIITGTNVNARSVPIVTRGTVVGKLNKDELLNVVEGRDGWFRVLAPERFQAWVKTSDLQRHALPEDNASALATQQPEPIPTKQPEPIATNSPLDGPRPINDNAWLYAQAPDAYTLQLASFDNEQKIADFVSRAKLINNPELHRFTAKGKNIEWTYFLYGSYSSTELAQVAKVEINQKLAWIRNFGQLQQNRCVAWKTQFPTPKELNNYCGGR
ncbi:MAG: septal ring-binding cell division protein DamX [Cryomorphaceae bacterium]|jgi:septal ring-binding cell division protein DamX